MFHCPARTLRLPLMLVAATLAAMVTIPLSASAAENTHLTLTLNGTTIEGDSTIISLGREDTIECFSFSQSGFTSTDRGSATRNYRPITIRKRIDKASPLLMQAWAQNHQGTAVFRFYRPNQNTGQTEHHYTIELSFARITAVSTTLPDTLDPDTASLPQLEIVSFEFDQIEYTDEINNTSFTDSLGGGV